MAQGSYTSLQIMSAAALMNGQGIKSLPSALTTAIANYQATTLISNWLAAINYYQAQSWRTESTLDKLLSLGNSKCPALGNSIPTIPLGNYPLLDQEYLPTQSDASTIDPYGFSALVQQTGEAYLGQLGGGIDLGTFAQGFMAVMGYINNVNSLIYSTVNAQTYLGPTFTGMSNLITNNLSAVTTDLPKFAVDVTNQGQLVNLKNLDLYGTPAGLVQQISAVAGIRNSTIPALRSRLARLGVSKSQIADVVNNNREGLFNANGLSINEFNSLQLDMYKVMTDIKGSELDEVLQILDVTTPNIETMADLINPIKVFPNSYNSLQTPTSNGYKPIYDAQNQVNMSLQTEIAGFLPVPNGCDELAKIIPPDQAVANKGIQAALGQITNITNTTLPELAQTVETLPRQPWIASNEYLQNDIVADAPTVNGLAQLAPSTEYYRAQQDVPAGTDINNTAYWSPTVLPGINTVEDLTSISALTSPLSTATISYIENSVATGTGPNGSITVCDVLGTAIDYNDFATRFNTATSTISAMQTAGTLTTLNGYYVSMQSAANDAAMLVLISQANTEIASIATSSPSNVGTLNTAWTYIANYLNQEKVYQTDAGVNYFALQSGEQNSVMSFAKSLEQYGVETECCGVFEFLSDIADTTVLGGQAIVGSLREGMNYAQLNANKLGIPETVKPSSLPPVIPSPCISPTN